MILVDTALEKRQAAGNPIRVAMVGAGFMARSIALNIITGIPGMKLVAIANRTLERARRVYAEAGADSVKCVETVSQLERAIDAGQYAITEDPLLLCQAERIEAVIDVTGQVELGARIALKAFEHGKHVILMNAELDATLGPILKIYADRAGVVLTDTDGDEPGVAMNLYRFVKTMGYRPVAAGNIKGMLDRYRNPDTQREFAAKWNQSARMVTSFADGTKLSLEETILANATGFRVGKRGMYGPACADVRDTPKLFPPEQLLNGGLVDYVVGAEPRTGAWVLAYTDHPVKQFYLDLFKISSNPFYCFYHPYHLPPLQLPSSVARAVLFHDATVAPRGAPICAVLTAAKRDLKTGEILDGIGGFTVYGLIDNAEVFPAEDLLPVGLSEGCRLMRDIPKDQPIRYADVVLPPGRLCDALRAEQDAYFGSAVLAQQMHR